MLDTHCHLTFKHFRDRTAQVVADAHDAGVSGMITVSTTSSDAQSALAVARQFPNVWCSAGVHPLYADEPIEHSRDWNLIESIGRSDRCVAWGELGLDNHYDKPARSVQDELLEQQLAQIQQWRAAGLEKPIIVHCREAFDELLAVFRKTDLPPDRFVFHCFTGTPEEARKVLDFGAMISFTGVVTFRNAPEVAEAAKIVPDDRIMVETDAPFLSPEPVRKIFPNEPKHVVHIARFIAELRGVGYDQFEQIVDDNARRFFNLQTEDAAESSPA